MIHRFKIEMHTDNPRRAAELLARGVIDAVVKCKQHDDYVVIAHVESLAAMAQVMYDLANPNTQPISTVSEARAVQWVEQQRRTIVGQRGVIDIEDTMVHAFLRAHSAADSTDGTGPYFRTRAGIRAVTELIEQNYWVSKA